MGFIFFIGGLITGVIISSLFRARERIHGIVHIDHETDQCIFSITSKELTDRKKKIAVFMINHDAEISREEQSL